ncbi:hypothetical protein AX15_002432 [Amanita polypyramis BW_CC]|nr:hypothetical protein AX15_002432 [Amanita polypyramis BW_CC]
MPVLSKLLRFHLTGKGCVADRLSYIACDNPICKHRNGLQPVEGRYDCQGRVPVTVIPSVLDLARCVSAPSRLCHLDGDDNQEESLSVSDTQPCPGTYYVNADQVRFVNYTRRVNRSERSQKAERNARSRALKIEKEVKKELKRDIAKRKKQMKEIKEKKKREERNEVGKEERERKEMERASIAEAAKKLTDERPSEEQPPEEQVVQQPERRLKRVKPRRGRRRLPVKMLDLEPTDTATETDAASDENGTSVDATEGDHKTGNTTRSPRSAVSPLELKPTPRRRNLSDSGPRRPRPVGMVFDDQPITVPTKPLWIRRSPNEPASGSGSSLRKKHDGIANDAGISTLTSTAKTGNDPAQNVRVSYKDGLMIVHCGRLLSAKDIQSVKVRSGNDAGGSARKRYLISQPRTNSLAKTFGPRPGSAPPT